MNYAPPTLRRNQPIPCGCCALYDPYEERHWSRQAVVRLVVGCIHGDYDWTETWLHLCLVDVGLADVTTKEFLRFWNHLLPKAVIQWWSSMSPEDPVVKAVLEDIRAVLGWRGGSSGYQGRFR